MALFLDSSATPETFREAKEELTVAWSRKSRKDAGNQRFRTYSAVFEI